MKTITVYKVVRTTEDPNIFSSSYVLEPLALSYSLRQRTTPNLGKIFAFRAMNNAKLYEKTLRVEFSYKIQFKILLCKATASTCKAVRNFNFPAYLDSLKAAINFWKTGKHSCESSQLQYSTVFCNWIEPVEICA